MTNISTNGCCSQTAIASNVPMKITNPPGLSAIRYRIGTFTSFRQAMLDSIAHADLMATAITTLVAPVQSTDTTMAVLDYSGFPTAANFQIKIGHEYLQVIDGAGTSIWKVVRGAAPGSYSTGDIVTLSPPNPFSGWKAAVASDRVNDYQTMFVELWAYLADILTFYQERIANEAYLGTASLRESLLLLTSLIDYRPGPGSGAVGLIAFTATSGSSLIVPANFRVNSKSAPGQSAVIFETSSAAAVLGDNSAIALSPVSPDVAFPLGTIVLQGVNNAVAVDDFVLAVENQGNTNEAAHLLQIANLTLDKTTNTTTITWLREIGDGPYIQASKEVSVYALRVTASPFGANSPAWNTLSPTLNNSDNQHGSAPYTDDWDTPTLSESLAANPWFYAPVPGDLNTILFLDATYRQLNYTKQNPGWAVLLTGGVFQVFHVIDSRQATKVAYAFSSKVTRLTFAESMNVNLFPIRDTAVMTGSTSLPIQLKLQLPVSLSGDELVLQGVQSQLRAGQKVIIKGNSIDANGPAVVEVAESAIVDGPPLYDAINNITRVKLKAPLTNTYVRSTCSVMGNIVEVTQGETVKDEVLGSGDGSALQTFPLKRKPLTYLPSTDPEGVAAVKSTLNVIVNGVAWNEKPDLVESAPNAQDFFTSLDDSGLTTVVFGDGFNGARLPSGANNIHASYRKGLGNEGNLPAGSIQQLVDSIPNLKKVTNPVPSTGGSDADSPTQIRSGAPASLRTFGRVVSATDYAALALNFPGISKAAATWISNNSVTGRAITHPYVQLTIATVDGTPIQGTLLASNLRRFLDDHRDPNVPLRFQDFSPVYIELIVEVEIDGHYPLSATLDKVQAALSQGKNADSTFGYFALQHLQFGQPIFLSAVYAEVQNIPGVADAAITSLRRVGPGTADPVGTAPHDIIVRPTEIAVIGTPDASQGQLIVTGSGGFIDA